MTEGPGAAATSARVGLRPVTEEDRDFLEQVYASTRVEELAQVDWTDEQTAAFVRMQFRAQDAYYREHYPDASLAVVMADGEPVGRLYVDRWPGEIRIMDIALLPERRNAGIGSFLLGRVMDEAAASGRKVSIHVELFNRALELYRRLGFVPVGEHGVYLLMEWTPPGPPSGRTAAQEMTAS